jgi:hypothetical protein
MTNGWTQGRKDRQRQAICVWKPGLSPLGLEPLQVKPGLRAMPGRVATAREFVGFLACCPS